jgi:cytochrome bd-type quinol oxidase subunit 2
MTIEIIVLALASTVRPTSLAAVYALLSHESRRGLMWAYVAGGLVFTLTFGGIIVGATQGVHFHAGSDETKGIAYIVGGSLALLFGLGVLSGRLGRGDVDAPKTDGRLKTALAHRVSFRTAALAGPATHIPGLFYLIALNVIVAHSGAVTEQAFALVTYNAIWFAVPIVSLLTCIVNPPAALDAVGWINNWTREHARTIILVASFGVGTALVVRGALTL